MVWSTKDALGGRYDPATDSWRGMSAQGAPAHNVIGFSMAWVAPYVIVWGGGEGVTQLGGVPQFPTATGGRYDVEHDKWLPMSTAGAPPARIAQYAVSTGKHLVVFGGYDEVKGPQSDAYRYDPAADHWEKLTGACIDPHVETRALAWLGHELLVWGDPAGDPQKPQPDQAWLLPLSP